MSTKFKGKRSISKCFVNIRFIHINETGGERGSDGLYRRDNRKTRQNLCEMLIESNVEV